MTRRTLCVLISSAFAIFWWEKPETKRSKIGLPPFEVFGPALFRQGPPSAR